jgi:hypothetical protein
VAVSVRAMMTQATLNVIFPPFWHKRNNKWVAVEFHMLSQWKTDKITTKVETENLAWNLLIIWWKMLDVLIL